MGKSTCKKYYFSFMKSLSLNIACLGAGSHAIRNTLPVLSNIDNFKLVGIYKRDFQSDLENLKKFKCKVSDDVDEILKIKNLDAVYISSKPSLHFTLAKKSLSMNKHVIVEKPAVTNFFQAKELHALASKKKLVIMEGFMYKFHRQFKEILNILKKNNKKKLLKISSTFGFPHLEYSNYRYNPKAGGGALLDAGTYVISSIRALSKNEVELTKSKIEKKNFKVDVTGFADFKSNDGCKFKTKWYFGDRYKNEISLKYKELIVIIKRAFSKPNNLVTEIKFYKHRKLIKIKKIKKDNHFKNMFNYFYNSCYNSNLRLKESFELLQQAKILNMIIKKNKSFVKV